MDIKLKKDKYNVDFVIVIIAALITSIAFIAGFWDLDHYLSMKDIEITKALGIFVWIKTEYLGYMFFCVIILFALLIIFKNKIAVKENIILSLYGKIFIEFKILLFIILCENLIYISSIVRYDYGYDLSRLKHSPYLQIIISFILLYCIIGDFVSIIGNKGNTEGKVNLLQKLIIYNAFLKRNKVKSFLKKILKTKNNLHLVIFGILTVMLILFICRIAYMNKFETYYIEDELILDKSIIAFITLLILCYTIILECEIIKIKELINYILKGKRIENKEQLYLLGDMENAICNIDSVMEKAIKQAVKSERMKSELITNVSHDLKTPLTSIINYVDLLESDNLSEEERKKYIGYLKNRSSRLKMLIEDLIEASKASSGNIKLEKEKLEVNALLRQTLGEYDDRIKKSKLNFIINIPNEKIYINGDGRRLFRVFQNLITNVLKYSLNNSRVYIDMYSEEEKVVIVFKNISKYILNVSEDELLEKFKRGDSSRSTEGNGLGLAITKSLVELHDGKFEIKIDGDLFKATVIFNKK